MGWVSQICKTLSFFCRRASQTLSQHSPNIVVSPFSHFQNIVVLLSSILVPFSHFQNFVVFSSSIFLFFLCFRHVVPVAVFCLPAVTVLVFVLMFDVGVSRGGGSFGGLSRKRW